MSTGVHPHPRLYIGEILDRVARKSLNYLIYLASCTRFELVLPRERAEPLESPGSSGRPQITTRAAVGLGVYRQTRLRVSNTATNCASGRLLISALPAGVEFIDENGGGAGVRLRKG
jgi:hypothetical protein